MISIPPGHELYDARLHIEWAKKHLDSLKASIAGYADAARTPHVFEEEINGERRTVVSWPPPAPLDDWARITADFARNLRAGLNFVAWQLAVKHVGDIHERTQFPIWSDKEDFKAKGRRQWRDILPAALDHIKYVQPYNRTERPETDLLTLLRELSDKPNHRFLVKPRSSTNLILSGATTFDFSLSNPVEVSSPMLGKSRDDNDLQPKATLIISIEIPRIDPPRERDISVLNAIYQFVTDEVVPPFLSFF